MDDGYLNGIYHGDLNETPLKHDYSEDECEIQNEA
jgi:hypothetical protein